MIAAAFSMAGSGQAGSFGTVVASTSSQGLVLSAPQVERAMKKLEIDVEGRTAGNWKQDGNKVTLTFADGKVVYEATDLRVGVFTSTDQM